MLQMPCQWCPLALIPIQLTDISEGWTNNAQRRHRGLNEKFALDRRFRVTLKRSLYIFVGSKKRNTWRWQLTRRSRQEFTNELLRDNSFNHWPSFCCHGKLGSLRWASGSNFEGLYVNRLCWNRSLNYCCVVTGTLRKPGVLMGKSCLSQNQDNRFWKLCTF